MEDTRREQREALQALTEYSPRLLQAMKNAAEELDGNRQPDTDGYLDSIIKGMNWELQILNATMDYINEDHTEIDKTAVNTVITEFNTAYQKKDDKVISELLKEEVILLFEKIAEAAQKKI